MNRKRGLVLLRLIGVLLIILGIFWAWHNIEEAHEADVASQKIVKQLDKVIDKYPVASEDGRLPIKTIDKTEYLGVLDIPSLNLHLPIAAQYKFEQMAKTPTRYRGSYLTNDMVLCAHNYPYHFDSLKTVDMGESLYFTTTDGQVYHYKISNRQVIKPTAVEEVYKDEKSSDDWDLSLFTCTKAGEARVLIRAQLIGINQ
ncbi:sortase [Streptococcus iniae]|uniref:sortase n=1 Tax=Streptococcus iniae TaxID=1346 RepID=UPI0008D8FF37|nr:sortase [Streptococcus iniae]OHX27051.1 sortase [Streptococcus iniae]